MFALVGILVAAFIICWLPQHTLNLFISFAKFQFTLEMFYLKVTSMAVILRDSAISVALNELFEISFRSLAIACHFVRLC